jgi:hypothetical protein
MWNAELEHFRPIWLFAIRDPPNLVLVRLAILDEICMRDA